MYRKGYTISCLLGVLCLCIMASCQGQGARGAHTQLAQAERLIDSGLYGDALSLIERAQSSAPTDSEVLRQATRLKRQLRQSEAEVKLLELDSAMRAHEQLLGAMLREFTPLRSEAYDTPLRYTHPQLNPSRFGARPHLRALVDTAGMLQLVSVYVGAKPKAHSAIELAFSDKADDSLRLPDLPHDDALNYRYTDGESRWELVTYTDMMAQPAIAYLSERLGKGGRLVVHFLSSGKCVYTYTMPENEAKALEKTLDLMRALEKRSELAKEQAKYARRFVRLSDRAE